MDEQLYEIQDGVRRAKAAYHFVPGVFGTPIAEVEAAEEELELFRQWYPSTS